MSVQQPKTNQAKYANLNLNAALSSKTGGQSASGPGLAQGTSTLTKGGLLLLSKRPRAATGVKLSVPKPVNLPSIKKEHAGNDPSTQLVPPSSGSGTWTKPEEPAAVVEPTPGHTSITAVSTWASQPKPAPSGPWQPSNVPAPRGLPGDRLLNPNEYPSLADSSKPEAVPVGKQGTRPEQDSRAWADDERAPPGGGAWRAPDWNNRADDDRYVGERHADSRAPWEHGHNDRGNRYEHEGAYGPPRPGFEDEGRGGRYGYGNEHGGYGGPHAGYQRGGDHPVPPPPPSRRYGGPVDRFDGPGAYEPYEERSLFPPPPPPRGQQSAEVDEDDDPERRAFEAELKRVAADLDRRKNEERESVASKRSVTETEDLTSQAESLAASDSDTVSHARSNGPPGPSRFVAREPLEDEEERRRRERASEKLRQLEQQMAARAAAAAPAPGPEAAQAAGEAAAAGKPPAGPWKKAAKEEEVAWDDDKGSSAPSKHEGSDRDLTMPRPGSTQAGAASKGLPPPPPPPPPPPRSQPQQQQQPQHQEAAAAAPPAAWQQQRPPAPPQQQQQAPAAVHPPQHLHRHNEAPRSAAAAGAAMFGSFDDDMFKELSKVPVLPAPQQQHTAPPKPWRPAEGSTPTLLSHAPAPAPAAPAVPPQPQSEARQEAPAGEPAAAAVEDSIGPKSGDAAGRGDRGRGRGGRGGRGTPAPRTSDEDQPAANGYGGRGGRGGRGTSAPRGRGGRGGGRHGAEEGEGATLAAAPEQQRAPSRGGEPGSRGGSAGGQRPARSSPATSQPGDASTVAVAPASAKPVSAEAQKAAPPAVHAPPPAPAASGRAGVLGTMPYATGLTLADPPVSQPPRAAGQGVPPSLAFDMQMGPAIFASPQRQPGAASLDLSDGAKSRVLDNGMLALPADLADVAVRAPVGRGLFGAAPGSSGMQGGFQQPIGDSYGGPFGTMPGQSAPGAAAAASSSSSITPPGIAAMWEQQKGKQPTGMPSAVPASTPGMPWPNMFSGPSGPGAVGPGHASSGGLANAPQDNQLVFGKAYGGFSAPVPPRSLAGQGQGGPFNGIGGTTWQPQHGQQPFLPSNKLPDWSISPQSSVPLAPLGALGFASDPQAVVPAVTANGGMSGFGHGLAGAPGAPLASGAPSGFSAAPGQQSSHAKVMHQAAGKVGGPFGLTPQQQQHQQAAAAGKQQHQQQRPAVGAAAAAVANLPDDLLDSKPVVAGAGTRPLPVAVPAVVGGRGTHAGGRDAADKPSGRGGSRGGGRGRGGRGSNEQQEPAGAATEVTRETAAGRGFAGRNGRGSGRSSGAPSVAAAPAPAPSAQPNAAAPAAAAGAPANGGPADAAAHTEGGRGGGRGGRSRGGGRGGASRGSGGRGGGRSGPPGPPPA